MLKKVIRIPLELRTKQTIDVPKNANIIGVDRINVKLCLMAIVDVEEKEFEIRQFLTIATGESFKENANYIGSHESNVGSIMQHIFEIV